MIGKFLTNGISECIYKDKTGKKIIDFKVNNLSVVNYSPL